MSPEESRQVLELVDRLQSLVIDLVGDVIKSRDPTVNARDVQAAMDELRGVAKRACERQVDPGT